MQKLLPQKTILSCPPPVVLRVRVNPRKTGRNNTGTDTEHWEVTPWKYFRSSADHSVPSSATRITTWFHGTIPSRPPRENIVFHGAFTYVCALVCPGNLNFPQNKKKKERKKETCTLTSCRECVKGCVQLLKKLSLKYFVIARCRNTSWEFPISP